MVLYVERPALSDQALDRGYGAVDRLSHPFRYRAKRAIMGEVSLECAMNYLRRSGKIPGTGPPSPPWETMVPGFVDKTVLFVDQYIAELLLNGAEEEDIVQHLKECEDSSRGYNDGIALRAIARIRFRRQRF